MTKYEFFCQLENDPAVFSVGIDPNESIGAFKHRIIEQESALRDISSKDLVLWKVDTPYDQEIDPSRYSLEMALNPTWRINKYWENKPPEEYIHILVRLPTSVYYSDRGKHAPISTMLRLGE